MGRGLTHAEMSSPVFQQIQKKQSQPLSCIYNYSSCCYVCLPVPVRLYLELYVNQARPWQVEVITWRFKNQNRKYRIQTEGYANSTVWHKQPPVTIDQDYVLTINKNILQEFRFSTVAFPLLIPDETIYLKRQICEEEAKSSPENSPKRRKTVHEGKPSKQTLRPRINWDFKDWIQFFSSDENLCLTIEEKGPQVLSGKRK